MIKVLKQYICIITIKKGTDDDKHIIMGHDRYYYHRNYSEFLSESIRIYILADK